MTLYAGVILLTELMMLTMTIHVMHYSGFTKVEKTWYLVTFVAIMRADIETMLQEGHAQGTGL